MENGTQGLYRQWTPYALNDKAEKAKASDISLKY